MPTYPAQQHVNSALSTFANAYSNSGFLADRLCPPVAVEKRSDAFFKRTRRDVSSIVNDAIGPKGRANESSYDVITDNYSVRDRALIDYVTDALIKNADAPLDPRELATQNLMQRLMLARESRVASLLGTSGNYASGSTAAVGAVWSDTTNSDPVGDINGAAAAIPYSGEESALIGWCSRTVWNALRKHPAVLALKGVTSGQVSKQEFAEYFELADFLVSDVFVDSANPGQAASYGRMWGSTIFGVVRVPSVLQGADISAFAVTFRVDPGIIVRSWDEPGIGVSGAEAVQVSMSDDEKICQNDMGYLLTSVL
jgi:hypothetical protein